MGRICVRLRKRLTNYFIVVRTDPLILIGINILLIVNKEIAENAVLGLCSSCLPLTIFNALLLYFWHLAFTGFRFICSDQKYFIT